MKKFKIENMHELYDERILKRGYEYYNEGRVKSASCYNDNTRLIKFKIQGTEVYTSYILLDKSEKNVLKMKCNCPYHNNCKHTAAALYYLKDGKDITIKVNEKKKNQFQNDLDIGLVFVLDRHTITSIDGFFDLLDRKVYEIEEDLYKRKTKVAADNLFYLLEKLDLVNRSNPSFCFDYDNDVYITDNYDLNNIEEIIQNCIYEIFLEDDKLLEKKLVKYIKKRSIWKHDISFFLDVIQDKATKEDQLLLLDMIANIKNVNIKNYTRNYLNYLEAKINLIVLNNKDYLKIAKRYVTHNSFIRDLLIDYYIDNEMEEEAIKLLKKDLNIISYNKLLEIYSNDIKNYNNTLLEMYRKFPSISLYEEIVERKIKVNKNSLLKELLHDNLNYGEIEFFIKNGFEDYMFDYLKYNINDLLRFSNLLKEKYNEELKEIIIDRIDDLMPTIRFKNTYDEVIRLLFKLSELNNGKKECKKIVSNIKKSQPNNITLLRELLYFQKTAY